MKYERPKLTFFSEDIRKSFSTEIYNVVLLLQSERITFQQSFQQLHAAKEDLTVIYYNVAGKIAAAEKTINDLRKHGRFPDGQLKEHSVLSLATTRAITGLKANLDAYGNGLLTKRDLKRNHRMMKDLLDADCMSLNREIRDMISQLKECDKMREEVSIRKVSEGST